MGKINIFSNIESVADSVKLGVNDAVEYWEEEIKKAHANITQLTETVEKIIVKVNEKFPEAKWNFGLGQDNEGWQLNIFTNAESSHDILDLIDPIEPSCSELGIFIVALTLQEAET